MEPEAREASAITFLDGLPKNFGGILIGGYAVSAYGPPRFSVDVDLVFPEGVLDSAKSWVEESGLVAEETMASRSRDRRLTKFRISGQLLSADLYFGGLRSRESAAEIDYEWIAERARTIYLDLTSGRTSTQLSVARPEALWTLKLLAGRAQDITDLFVISESPIDQSEVRSKLQSLHGPKVRQVMRRVVQLVDSDAEYRDAVSRRSMGSPDLPRNRQKWQAFRLTVKSILSWIDAQP